MLRHPSCIYDFRIVPLIFSLNFVEVRFDLLQNFLFQKPQS